MIGVYQQKRVYYTYQKGELIRIESKNFKGQKIDSFATKNKQSFTKKTPLDNRHHDMIFDVCKENKTIALGRTNDAEHPVQDTLNHIVQISCSATTWINIVNTAGDLILNTSAEKLY